MATVAPKKDRFALMIVGAAVLALLLPATGFAGQVLSAFTTVGVALLFFLYGGRLSREALLAGATNLKLHALILGTTFLVFPLLGLLLRPVMAPFVGQEFLPGLLFLCALPSTVQSAIAMTSLARGNIAAAICAASLSSAVGLVVTPVLVSVLLSAEGAHVTVSSVIQLVVSILLPFVVGHLLRPKIGPFLDQRAKELKFVDQGSIVLLVYGAFSHAVEEQVFNSVSWKQLVAVAVCVAVLLACALLASRFIAKAFKLKIEDEIALVFCGSKKGLTSGLPVAHALFPGAAGTLVVLPLMLFHQLQLMVCTVLAKRWADRPER